VPALAGKPRFVPPPVIRSGRSASGVGRGRAAAVLSPPGLGRALRL